MSEARLVKRLILYGGAESSYVVEPTLIEEKIQFFEDMEKVHCTGACALRTELLCDPDMLMFEYSLTCERKGDQTAGTCRFRDDGEALEANLDDAIGKL